MKRAILICVFSLINLALYSQSGLTCSNDKFWAKHIGLDYVYEFQFGPDTVINNGVILNLHTDASLAVCNNLNNGNYSPTFYSTKNNKYVVYYDGTDEVITSDSAGVDKINNPAGSGNFLYYMLFTPNLSRTKGVARYDGNNFTTVYSWDSTRRATVYDLGVDSLGNVYVFTGQNNVDVITDTLVVVSPTGNVIKKYPLNMQTGGFGVILNNNKIYIGHGSLNSYLTPITLTETTATVGTPYIMPNDIQYGDLASCGSKIIINNIDKNMAVSGIGVYPNPASNDVSISWNNSKPVNLRVFNMAGKLIVELDKVNSGYNLSTQNMANGLYLIQVISGNKTSTQKLIVQH